jgi:hypothetical protein
VPDGIVPHLGSQWWCLTRETLARILSDPDGPRDVRFFRRVWIPDESYFQTVVRRHARQIESRSLTLARFDFEGRPHVFYDDHLELLEQSDRFMARKIWPRADGSTAISSRPASAAPRARDPARIERVFARALERRTRGRPGLCMQSRFPKGGWENARTAAPYSIHEGFADLFEDWDGLARPSAECAGPRPSLRPRPRRFAGDQTEFAGALSDSATLRDYNPVAFLTNLVWNTRGERQCFAFGPADAQGIAGFIASDPNARVSVISGAWLAGLLRENLPAAELRRRAAVLQATEAAHLDLLRAAATKAQVRIWTLAEFLEAPGEALQIVQDDLGGRSGPALLAPPRMADLSACRRSSSRCATTGCCRMSRATCRGWLRAEPAPRRTPRRSAACTDRDGGAFDHFVILADMRTGSNLLEESLNACAGLRCHGEVFNPRFIGHEGEMALFGLSLDARDRDPGTMIDRLKAEAPGLGGFRLFPGHDPRVLDRCLADPRCAKIVLARNPVDSYVSLKIARQTGQWWLGDHTRAQGATAHFDAEEFDAYLHALRGFYGRVRHALQCSGQTAFHIHYDDLRDAEVLGGLARWLGAEAPRALADPGAGAEPRAARGQGGELRRDGGGAGPRGRLRPLPHPRFRAAARPERPGAWMTAGSLLFVPLPGGPVERVAGWMAGRAAGRRPRAIPARRCASGCGRRRAAAASPSSPTPCAAPMTPSAPASSPPVPRASTTSGGAAGPLRPRPAAGRPRPGLGRGAASRGLPRLPAVPQGKPRRPDIGARAGRLGRAVGASPRSGRGSAARQGPAGRNAGVRSCAAGARHPRAARRRTGAASAGRNPRRGNRGGGARRLPARLPRLRLRHRYEAGA